MINEIQIRERLQDFLESRIDLDAFEDWLVAASWNMHLDSDEATQRLVSAIELRLSEFSSGHLAEPRLRNELSSLVPRNLGITIERSDPIHRFSSGTSNWLESPVMPLQRFEPVGIKSS